MNTPEPEPEVLPTWLVALQRRADDPTLPDSDLRKAVEHIAKLRREHIRMFNQLTANFARIKTALDLLDEIETEPMLNETCRRVRAVLTGPVEPQS